MFGTAVALVLLGLTTPRVVAECNGCSDPGGGCQHCLPGCPVDNQFFCAEGCAVFACDDCRHYGETGWPNCSDGPNDLLADGSLRPVGDLGTVETTTDGSEYYRRGCDGIVVGRKYSAARAADALAATATLAL